MSDVVRFEPGGYRYIAAGFQFSSGIAAEPGFEVERCRFSRHLPLAEGFAAVEAHLKSIGRPTTALAAFELRSPAPFTGQGFHEFNREYVKTLERWGIFAGDRNPVARTNVCPQYNPPAEPSVYAFSYTVPAKSGRATFVISGSTEQRATGGQPAGAGDVSREAMREKVRDVVGSMERRLAALGFGWKDASGTCAYTVQDIGALVGPEIAARGAAGGGLTWHFARPPVIGLEFEMDVRCTAREFIL